MLAKIPPNEKVLIRRYLLWCYKTTKESLDKIDRKFTQVKVDRQILNYLRDQDQQNSLEDEKYVQLISDFEKYIDTKDREGKSQKFLSLKTNALKADYLYLQRRLTAVKKAIRYFLGARELNEIQSLYEQEMTHRILESREH